MDEKLIEAVRTLPVPFAITARVGEGGISREYHLLWIDVWRAVYKDAVL